MIQGPRPGHREPAGERYHRVERVCGEFRRSLRLPQGIDREQITADYQAGVLSVTLPKNREQAARKIQIRSQSPVTAESSAAQVPQAEQHDSQPQSS